MKEHTWKVEEVDGGPAEDAEARCYTCRWK